MSKPKIYSQNKLHDDLKNMGANAVITISSIVLEKLIEEIRRFFGTHKVHITYIKSNEKKEFNYAAIGAATGAVGGGAVGFIITRNPPGVWNVDQLTLKQLIKMIPTG
jgi:preprotein translocase subunit Sss1